jgi:hypothetical protein
MEFEDFRSLPLLYKLDANRRPVRCHNPAEWAEWAATAWRDKIDARRVADTKVGDSRVSTVFLPMPIFGAFFFETMVHGGPADGLTSRYQTWNEAEAGHKAWVALVTALQNRLQNQP